jgi:protein TonB
VKRLAFGLLLGLSMFALTPAAQVPQRDRPPAYVEAARLEADLKAEIAAEGLTVERGMRLVRLLVRQGKTPAALDALEDLGRVHPQDRTVHYTAATFYEELVRRGSDLTPQQTRAYLAKGIAASDRALAVDPIYYEALVYKNILLRHQARLETDPVEQRRLIDEADLLRARAIELQKTRAASGPRPGESRDSAPPPPPPPPPGITPPCDRSVSATLQAPIRVGGNIKAPTKVKDVRPMYPAEAQAAKIQGVVIIEATIDEYGRIVQACVLRSIPLLDEAALQAVGQWEFTPTLLNGAPVPVIMTVTVNFTLAN